MKTHVGGSRLAGVLHLTPAVQGFLFDRMRSFRSWIALAACSLAVVAVVDVVGANFDPGAKPGYAADFESGAGLEWSSSATDNSIPGVFTRFSGRFGNSSQTLTLGGLTANGSYVLLFDLYIIDSWDDGNTTSGDRIRITVDGVEVFLHTFSQFDLNSDTYPLPPDAQGQYGFSGWNESIYRTIEIPFGATGTTVTITFQGAGLQSLDDESWGLDNVGVWASADLPATQVTAASLPAEASVSAVAIDRFNITTTRILNGDSATTPSNYELRNAGADGLFGGADDTVYSLAPSYALNTKTVSFTTSPNPLQPGKYRFLTKSTLLDGANAPVSPFTRFFTITSPVVGAIENTDNGLLMGATALPMTETPPASGFYTAFALGTFQAAGDVDYWRFEAEAGDRVTIRVETANGSIYPYVYLRNAADSNVVSPHTRESALGQIQDAVIPSPGTYYVRLWSDHGASPYSMRVDHSRGMQLEVEANDTQAAANSLALTLSGGVLGG
ncbi:MAG TPA: PPC domain-containing protein, partial [Verrucomicrobiota bacterium]|nr:PPC domain-containing protein [Verrucomicrobiota bacterium]